MVLGQARQSRNHVFVVRSKSKFFVRVCAAKGGKRTNTGNLCLTREIEGGTSCEKKGNKRVSCNDTLDTTTKKKQHRLYTVYSCGISFIFVFILCRFAKKKCSYVLTIKKVFLVRSLCSDFRCLVMCFEVRSFGVVMGGYWY